MSQFPGRIRESFALSSAMSLVFPWAWGFRCASFLQFGAGSVKDRKSNHFLQFPSAAGDIR